MLDGEQLGSAVAELEKQPEETPSLGKQPEETPSLEPEPVPSKPIESLSKEEHEAEISKAEASVQSALMAAHQREKDELNARLATLESERVEREIQARESRELEQWGDTPEVRDFQLAKRAFEEEKGIFETEALSINAQSKVNLAIELSQNHGVSKEELLKCNTWQEMRKVAANMEIAKLRQEIASSKRLPDKVLAETPSATAFDIKNLTPDKTLEYGFRKLNRK